MKPMVYQKIRYLRRKKCASRKGLYLLPIGGLYSTPKSAYLVLNLFFVGL